MFKTEYTPIRKMTAGETYNRPVLVLSMEERVARNNNPFVALKLTDGDSIITVNNFGATSDDMNLLGIEPGAIADVAIYVKDPYYNLADICLCDDPDITYKDFVRSAPIDPEIALCELYAMIEKERGNAYDDSVVDVTLALLKENEEKFKTSSAAKFIHHNILSGLIYHSYRMAQAAKLLSRVYTILDSQLLVCAAIIHDIGKLKELDTSTTGAASYTVSGRLFGHAEIGMEMVAVKASTIAPFSERVNLLKHCIAAHHGKYEYGSIALPAIPEAQALHIIDLMDARMYQFEETYKEIEFGTLSGKVFGLENSTVYKPLDDPFSGFIFPETEVNENEES